MHLEISITCSIENYIFICVPQRSAPNLCWYYIFLHRIKFLAPGPSTDSRLDSRDAHIHKDNVKTIMYIVQVVHWTGYSSERMSGSCRQCALVQMYTCEGRYTFLQFTLRWSVRLRLSEKWTSSTYFLLWNGLNCSDFTNNDSLMLSANQLWRTFSLGLKMDVTFQFLLKSKTFQTAQIKLLHQPIFLNNSTLSWENTLLNKIYWTKHPQG
jgi:hypothetical protein